MADMEWWVNFVRRYEAYNEIGMPHGRAVDFKTYQEQIYATEVF
jgi:hypothetical protein